jgi:hypothetical protein
LAPLEADLYLHVRLGAGGNREPFEPLKHFRGNLVGLVCRVELLKPPRTVAAELSSQRTIPLRSCADCIDQLVKEASAAAPSPKRRPLAQRFGLARTHGTNLA